MPRRSAVPLVISLALTIVLGVSCSRSEHKPAADSARTLAQIWAEVLGERDTIHLIFIKEIEEVNHQDCADLGAAARRIDDLTGEMVNSIGATSGQGEDRLRSIGNAVSRMASVTTKIRETALAESPGAFPELRFPLDYALHDIEYFFSADDLGHESVMARPGYETAPLPPPLSPI
jgi:hypothetical protein